VKLNVPQLDRGDGTEKPNRPSPLILSLFVAGFVGLVALLAYSFLRPASVHVPGQDKPPTLSSEAVNIPEPAPLPDLDARPPTKPLDVYLLGDPFPPPPPPQVAKPSPARQHVPSNTPPLPKANSLALYVTTNDLRYIGYVGGERAVGTFTLAGRYLVMFQGDTIPGTQIRIASLSPDRAVLYDGQHRYALTRH